MLKGKKLKNLLITVAVLSVLVVYRTLIFKVFSRIYNYIQSTPFFTNNLFNFIIVAGFFIWLLFYFLDVVGIMEKKSKETALAISNSENKKAEAQEQLENTKKSLQNIDKEVKEIVDEAKTLAENIEHSTQEKLEEELENIKNRENLLKEAQVSKTKTEVSVVIANAAVAISKEYIEKSLDENAHKELIYNFINDLDEGIKL